ncbi:MAG: multidrug effflux MFS transporter [Gammaproteobacteria bacterium]|nr:multidrug effflux MFS transporter [Gammaproteobacteria bacterium]
MSGIALFCVASFVVIFIKNIGPFLILRFLQGIGIGALGACFRAIISDMCTSEEQQQHINAIYAIIGSLSPTFAPVIGGYLQHYINWHANFIFYTIYSGIALILLAFTRETNLQRQPFHFKTVIIHYGLVLTNANFWAGVILMTALYSTIIIFSTVSPFLIQNVLHYNAAQYGHILFFLGLMLFLGMILYRQLLKRYRAQQLLYAILWIWSLLTLLILAVALLLPLTLWYLIVPIAVLYFFLPGLFPCGMTIAMARFSHIAGVAGAVIGFSFVGLSMSSAIPAPLIHADNAIVLALTYCVELIICWLVYLTILRRYFREAAEKSNQTGHTIVQSDQ